MPVHVPGEAVRRLPSPACPLMVGSCVLLGAAIVANCVLLGAAVVTARVSHHLFTPEMGSPKTAVVQSTPPVNVLGLVHLPFAPKWTSIVPVKAQRLFSQAQNDVQPA